MEVTREIIVSWLEDYARELESNKSYLTELDGAIGDNDHGINMDRGFRTVLQSLPDERDKPLALYVFSESHEVQARVVEETSSGGVAVNATMLQLAVPELPFGGVGPSGIGAYHGHAGFDTFSHKKSVLSKSTRLDPDLAYPPYTRLKNAILHRFL